MCVIDFFIAIFAPIIVPLLDFALSKITFTSRVKGKNLDDCKKVENLSIFFKELPSAFIGNAIWGFTYNIQKYTKSTIIWMCLYFFISFISVGFLIVSYIRNLNLTKYKMSLIIFSFFLIITTVIRIIIS